MVPVVNSNQASSAFPAFRSDAMEARFSPVDIPSSRFYLSNTASVPAAFPYPPYFGGYTSVDWTLLHRCKGDGAFQGLMGFHPGFQTIPYPVCADEEKPTQSYIGLIGKAILSSPQKKLVLSDIYNHILTHYPYFRNKGPGWRNSIRHNLSLNDCFIKVGRSPNGKGHYWAINPVNYDDFSRGEYKRKRAPKKNRETSSTEASPKRKTTATGRDSNPDSASKLTTDASTCSDARLSDNTSGLEKRGFHIETLLSSPWQAMKNCHTGTCKSAFTAVTHGLSFPAEHSNHVLKPVMSPWSAKPLTLCNMTATTFYDKDIHVV